MLTQTYKKDRIKQAEIIPLDKVKPLDIDWLWPGHIPLGMLTLIAGDPGVGKSFLTLYMAATVSAGLPWPRSPVGTETPQSFPKEKFAKQIYCGATLAESGVECPVISPPGSVLILNNEDIPTKILCPRLSALNADLSKIKLIPFVWRSDENGNEYSAQFNIVSDIFALEMALSEIPDVKLIIIDPLLSYFGCRDTYRDSFVRSSLLPLSNLARKYNVAVVCVMHLNKGSSSKIFNRIMGSLAFSSTARTVWFVHPLPDTENKKRCLFTPAKHNLLENPRSLVFEIKDNRVVFENPPINTSARSVSSSKSNIESPELNRVVDWLKNLLIDGNPLPSKKIFTLAKEHGFTNRTLQRARKELHINCFPEKDSQCQTYWSWKLPILLKSVCNLG
jgi:putative DNA primase/helicase